MAGSERKRELRRRRHRSKKVPKLKALAEKASASDRKIIAAKLRKLTPGAETIIEQLQLETA